MANLWRIELDKFLKDECRNACSMKIESQKGRTINFSFLDDLYQFTVELDGDAKVKRMTCNDADISSWAEQLTASSSSKPLAQFLEYATSVFLAQPESTVTAQKHNELEDMFPDDNKPAPHRNDNEPQIVTDASNDDEEEPEPETSFLMNEPEDLPFEPLSAQRVKDMQRKQVANYLGAQVEKTVNRLQFNDFVTAASGNTLDNVREKKKADKDMYVRFFLNDVFTIDDGPPRKRNNPSEKTILEAFSKGFVPSELCGAAADVDLHVIYVEQSYEDHKREQQEEVQQAQQEEDEELQRAIHESMLLSQQQQPEKLGAPSSVHAKPPAPAKAIPRPKFTYKHNPSKPSTTIQFCFEDGTKSSETFNSCDPVEILYSYVKCNEHGPLGTFMLTVLPKNNLDDRKATLAQQKLDRAVVHVKSIKN